MRSEDIGCGIEVYWHEKTREGSRLGTGDSTALNSSVVVS